MHSFLPLIIIAILFCILLKQYYTIKFLNIVCYIITNVHVHAK